MTARPICVLQSSRLLSMASAAAPALQGLHGNLAGELSYSWVSVATTGRSQETAAQEGRLAFRPERTHRAEEAPDILSSFPNPCWPVLSPIPLASPSPRPHTSELRGLYINSNFYSQLRAWPGFVEVAVFVFMKCFGTLCGLCL